MTGSVRTKKMKKWNCSKWNLNFQNCLRANKAAGCSEYSIALRKTDKVNKHLSKKMGKKRNKIKKRNLNL